MSDPIVALPMYDKFSQWPYTPSILYSYSKAVWLILETKIWAFMMKLHTLSCDEVRKLINDLLCSCSYLYNICDRICENRTYNSAIQIFQYNWVNNCVFEKNPFTSLPALFSVKEEVNS